MHGEVAPGFEGVRAEFERCFAELGETGASFHALVGGRVVADLWGGIERDSLVNVYSVTKPMAAFCVLVLADRGLLGLDDPVARFWPEFAAAGKENVTVRQLLSHQAGLPALRDDQPPELLFDWHRLCSLLAAEPPWWEPGSGKHAEHALFYGHLCGELVRRVDGRSLGTFWREEVARPWGIDFHIGLGEAELSRAVDLVGEHTPPGNDLYRRAVMNPPGARDLDVVNGTAWREAEIPAVNGHGNAAGVARFFSMVPRDRLVSEPLLTAFDPVIDQEVTWGFGVWVDSDGYGMGGIGGSLAMADPELDLAYAYVTRKMGSHDRSEAMDAAIRRTVRPEAR